MQAAKVDIMAALAEKGVDVTGKNLVDVPNLIDSIEVQPEGVVIGGRTYKTVKIGNQEWLAENLDFKASGIDIAPSGTPTTPAAWYYKNNESTYGVNGNKYGLLYNWYAVKYLNDKRATLIPGWHVPTTDEWDALATAVGGTSVAGTHLKSATRWSSGNGLDDFGFSAFPAGTYMTTLGSFDFVSSFAFFWTSTEYSSNKAYYCRYAGSSTAMSSYDCAKDAANSVRLVKDA